MPPLEIQGVWDIETTSLSPQHGYIREVYTRIGNSIFHAWICNSNTMKETEVSWTVPTIIGVYPGQCPSEKDLLNSWLMWLENQPAANIWGYNSSKFDLPWMEEKLMQYRCIPQGLPGIKHNWLDFYVLMQQLIPRGQSRKLTDIWKNTFPNEMELNAHQASDDAEMLHQLITYYQPHANKMAADPRRGRSFFWAGDDMLKKWTVRQFMFQPRMQIEKKTWMEWMNLYHTEKGDFDTENGLRQFCERHGFHGDWIFSMWKVVWRTFQLWEQFKIHQPMRGIKRRWNE